MSPDKQKRTRTPDIYAGKTIIILDSSDEDEGPQMKRSRIKDAPS